MVSLFYIALFFVFSFLGFFLDSGYRSILHGRFIRSGYFPLPLCPLYGFGGLVLVFVYSTSSFLPAYVQIIIAGFAVVLLEFGAGVLCVRFLHARLWDYSQIPWNVCGHINAFHSIMWFFAVMVFYYAIFPLVSSYRAQFLQSATFTATDTVVAITAILLGLCATWLQYTYGPRHYCRIPGYTKRKRKKLSLVQALCKSS